MGSYPPFFGVGPNWTAGWSDLDRKVVRTGPLGGPNWTAKFAKSGRSELDRDFYVSKTEYLSRARAKEPVPTTKTGPNWTASEELGGEDRCGKNVRRNVTNPQTPARQTLEKMLKDT